MNQEAQSVITGGALAVLILREVFAFLKTRKANGHNGKEHAEIVGLLAAIREDTKMSRASSHTILNALSGMKGATEILIDRLEQWDRRK